MVSGNFLCYLETFQVVWKLSRWSGNFPGRLETFQIIRKLSKLSGNFPGCQKLYRICGNLPDYVETFHMIWKLSRSSGNFPDHQKTFQTIWKLSTNILEITVIQRVDFIATRKNFTDAQKVSGWQCQTANQVFLPLLKSLTNLCGHNKQAKYLDHFYMKHRK